MENFRYYKKKSFVFILNATPVPCEKHKIAMSFIWKIHNNFFKTKELVHFWITLIYTCNRGLLFTSNRVSIATFAVQISTTDKVDKNCKRNRFMIPRTINFHILMASWGLSYALSLSIITVTIVSHCAFLQVLKSKTRSTGQWNIWWKKVLARRVRWL